MKNRKIIMCYLLVIMNLFLLSCSKKEINEEANIDLFNPKAASEVAKDYLNYVKENNIKESNNLCTDQLISKNKEISMGGTRIISYAPDNLIESSGSAYILFNVVRNSESESRCDLDNYAIKVVKIGDEYKIDEIKSINKKQVFVRDRSLRVIGEDGGKSDLILTLNNLPRDIYLSENKVMLYKEQTPNEKFGPISIGYRGQKVAISTIGDNKSFISIAYMEESKEAQAQAQSEEAGGSADKGITGSTNLEEVLDKPIAKKVISLDILDNIKLQDLIFSKEEEYLIVSYLNSNSLNRMNVYSTSKGDLIKLKFNEMFPEDKYNIALKEFDKNTITIEVTGKTKLDNINKEVIGNYKVNMEEEEIEKIFNS